MQGVLHLSHRYLPSTVIVRRVCTLGNFHLADVSMNPPPTMELGGCSEKSESTAPLSGSEVRLCVCSRLTPRFSDLLDFERKASDGNAAVHSEVGLG